LGNSPGHLHRSRAKTHEIAIAPTQAAVGPCAAASAVCAMEWIRFAGDRCIHPKEFPERGRSPQNFHRNSHWKTDGRGRSRRMPIGFMPWPYRACCPSAVSVVFLLYFRRRICLGLFSKTEPAIASHCQEQ
jgi:hypothetical protein